MAAPINGQIACVPWRDMLSDIAAWDQLTHDAAQPNPFFESWYLLPSLKALDPGGDIAILRFEQAGVLRGLIPLERSSRYYGRPVPHLGNWLHANSFLGAPLVAKGCEVDFWRAILCWADQNAGRALFFHLRELPLDGPLYPALQKAVLEKRRHWQCVHLEERALLSSELDADSYWQASLSGKKRKELRRQLNRLQDEGEVKFERREDAEHINSWADSFLTLEASGWKGKSRSALHCDPATEGLFRESLQQAAQQGRLERLTLSLAGRPIAMLATFLTPPGAFSYKTAFDEDYARFSVGVLLQHENLNILGNAVIKWTDSCASAEHPMINHIWRERRTLGCFSIAIGGMARRLAFRQLSKFESAYDPQQVPT